jgi:hypothetical protein
VRAVQNRNERVELMAKILKYRQTAGENLNELTAQRIGELIAELGRSYAR